jgi:hypothetical protein
VRSQLENGNELPNCFLERSRLGRPLPCAIRLRTQRSDHMAVVCVARLTPACLEVIPSFTVLLTKIKVLTSRQSLSFFEGNECEIHGYSAMQRAWDIELI